MKFLPLPELLKHRERLARQLTQSELSDGAGLTAEDAQMVIDVTRELLADLDEQIAERTGAVLPDQGSIV